MLSATTLRITATVVHGLAQICTVLRLAYQTRKHRLWMDDGFVAFATAASIAWLVCFWIRTDIEGVGPFLQSNLYRLRAYWADGVTFLIVVWFTRIGVLLSTIRLAPPGLISRQIPLFASILFLLMWASLVAQRIYLCHHDMSWESSDEAIYLNETMKITNLAFELFSDAILLASPILTLLCSVSTTQHRLLLLTFGSSFIFTCVSVAHAASTIRNFGEEVEDLTAIIQSGASLLFANLVAGVMFAQNLDAPDGISDERPKKRAPTSTLKSRIGKPQALNSVHLQLAKGRESFGTSSPLRYAEASAVMPLHDILFDEKENHLRDSAIYVPDISNPNQPYGVRAIHSPPVENSRPTSYQSSISAYSPRAESSLSTLRDIPDALTPPPVAVTKNVRFLSPQPAAVDSDCSSTYSSIFSNYLGDYNPFSETQVSLVLSPGASPVPF